MDLINTSRLQTDQSVAKTTIPVYLQSISDEKKIQVANKMIAVALELLAAEGVVRTENMAEIATALLTNGEVVQADGYDIVTEMRQRTEVKTVGTRANKKARQAPWRCDTAQVKLSKAKASAEYFLFYVSLNRQDAESDLVMYLIPRVAMLNKHCQMPTGIDFDYGSNATLDPRCQWYQYHFTSIDELPKKYERFPLMTTMEELFA